MTKELLFFDELINYCKGKLAHNYKKGSIKLTYMQVKDFFNDKDINTACSYKDILKMYEKELREINA